MTEIYIGKVSHYFNRLGVATLDLEVSLASGERVHFLGHTTDLEQTADSMEIDHRRIDYALPGEAVAIKVEDRVRPGDKVYLEIGELSSAA